MHIDAALVEEQGVRFAVISVKGHVLNSALESHQFSKNIAQCFPPGIPIILMGSNAQGRVAYRGRKDIVRFLSKVNITRLPWKRYHLSTRALRQ